MQAGGEISSICLGVQCGQTTWPKPPPPPVVMEGLNMEPLAREMPDAATLFEVPVINRLSPLLPVPEPVACDAVPELVARKERMD